MTQTATHESPEAMKASMSKDCVQPARRCRFCGRSLRHTFVDLGMSPLCESYLDDGQLNDMEPFYPLHVFVCDKCLLVQLLEYVTPDRIFTEYAYFSSYSDSWLQHAKSYTEMIAARLGLNSRSQVVEVASNDGYLLQFFLTKGVKVLGVEPAANVAAEATRRGIPTVVRFFGKKTAEELVAGGCRADLLLGNNVLAHVPDLNDFVAGLKVLLAAKGTLTMEFPHLMRLIEGNQFDTIYHEHFCYFSLLTVERVFAAHEISLFDVEELSTHGGSLRVFGRHSDDHSRPVSSAVVELRERELRLGYGRVEFYSAFSDQVRATKRSLLEFLIHTKQQGRTVAGYGAPGKGNTLLNYCGIRTDFMDYTVDRNPYKHGKFLPGTHIPVFPPEHIAETRPDFVLILPWNLETEIVKQLAFIREWNGQFVVPIPRVKVF